MELYELKSFRRRRPSIGLNWFEKREENSSGKKDGKKVLAI